MTRPNTATIFHSFLYGGASVLLALDLFFLVKALFQNSFVPLVPIIAGIFIAGGLLLVLHAEQKTRELDKKEHRRLSRVAHQLESPLQALQEDLAYLVKISDSLPAAARLKLKRMDTKAAILLENIRDVFLMLRAQQGAVVQERRAYDICVVVKQAVDHVHAHASARNVNITYKAHCQDAGVMIDKTLFLIALTHILGNAIQYSIMPGLVNVAILKGKSSVRVLVQDRGIGIKDQDADDIFRPYARGDKAEQFDPDGIGVGLTLSKLLVEEMGGTIRWRPRAKSAGTEFELKLPLVSEK